MAGQANVYDMTRADEPTQEGTPLNKASLLQDDTAALLALEQEDPTVNDALYALAIGGLTTGTTIITVLDAEGKPIAGVAINGLTDEGGNAVTTGQNGKATVICTAVTSVTFSSGCIDLVDVTQTITPKTPGVNLVTVTMPFEAAGTVKLITASGAVKFYKARTVDLCLVGGGTGGWGGSGGEIETENSNGGPGGSGGKVLSVMGASVPKVTSTLAVGAGGLGGTGGSGLNAGSGGGTGGDTTFLDYSSAAGNSATAPFDTSGVGSKVGGEGGRGGYGGPGNTNGSAGTRGGGAGGAGAPGNDGATGTTRGSDGSAGTTGGGGGGGGGGGYTKPSSYRFGYGGTGGKGGDGCLMVRIL